MTMTSSGSRHEVSIGRQKPFTRWWWYADSIRNDQISEQLEWAALHGFGGVEIAWVYPSSPDSQPEPFLSPAWSALVHHAWKECVRLGLGCDLTFGSLWPFGGSWVDEAHALQYWDGPSPQRLRKSWESGHGHPETRIMNHLSTEALEQYARQMLAGFAPILEERNKSGQGLPVALFCDSMEIHPEKLWCSDFDAEFQRTWGYSLTPYLETLNDEPQRRYEYRHVMARLFLERFYRPFHRICNEAGCLCRVQVHGAPVDLMLGYAACDIPETEAILFDPEFARLAASTATFEGQRVVSSESFTCLYGWVRSPGPAPHGKEELLPDLKLVADALFACGVNHHIWHGMPFSTRENRREFYATVHVGPDGALAPHFKAFNAYLARTSALLQEGRPLHRLGVYLPMEDMLMRDKVPENRRKPSSEYWWELHDLRWPSVLDAFHPVWVSPGYLAQAWPALAIQAPGMVSTGSAKQIQVGQINLPALWCDAEYLSPASLKKLVLLAEAGCRIYLGRLPVEPGTVHAPDWENLLERLQQAAILIKPEQLKDKLPPLLEAIDGLDLPLYRCRLIEEGHMRCFIAHPGASGLSYPLPYGHAGTLGRIRKHLRLHPLAASTHIPSPPSADLELDFNGIDPYILDVHWDSKGISVDKSRGSL